MNLLLALFLAAPARAGGSAVEAERARLSDDLRVLARRGAWEGVDGVYRRLESLGVDLSYRDCWIGAQAAQAMGDAAETRERLLDAAGVDETAEVEDWIDYLDSEYARVRLTVARRFRGESTLVPVQMPVAPDQRAALATAAEDLEFEGAWEGLLPAGTYELGGTSFEAVPGANLLKVVATRAEHALAVRAPEIPVDDDDELPAVSLHEEGWPPRQRMEPVSLAAF